jgi:hypothetical protein
MVSSMYTVSSAHTGGASALLEFRYSPKSSIVAVAREALAHGYAVW